MSDFDYDLSQIQSTTGGLDAYFEKDASLVTPTGAEKVAPVSPIRHKVARLSDLDGFLRTATDTLVHKSNRDLWSLQKDPQGAYFIERLFDAASGPLKEG